MFAVSSKLQFIPSLGISKRLRQALSLYLPLTTLLTMTLIMIISSQSLVQVVFGDWLLFELHEDETILPEKGPAITAQQVAIRIICLWSFLLGRNNRALILLFCSSFTQNIPGSFCLWSFLMGHNTIGHLFCYLGAQCHTNYPKLTKE